MAALGKCPRCYCEGNRVGCETCYYSAFCCPGNCACCEDNREASAQFQARKGNSKNQKEHFRRHKRAPLRPLILRDVKKAMIESQRKAAALCKEDNSAANENTNKVNLPIAQKPKVPKVDAETQTQTPKQDETDVVSILTQTQTPKHEETDLVEAVTELLTPKHEEADIVDAEAQTPKHEEINIVDTETQTLAPKLEETHIVDAETETETPKKEETDVVSSLTQTQTPKHEEIEIVTSQLIKSYNEYVRKDNEAKRRLYNELLWPQYVKIPCEPYDPQKVDENKRNRVTTANISKELFEEGIHDLIGNHCLNCHCKNPRESCDICKQMDYQCLGTCLCCLHFRASQRYMIFITRGLYRLPNGSFYGGGNVTMSCSA